MKRFAAAGVVLFVALCASPAGAQTAFVQGGMAMDARRFSGGPDGRVFDANTSAIMAGGGGFLTPVISAGVELDFGRESEAAETSSITIAGRPETVTTTFTGRRRSVSALFGIHSSAQRVVRIAAYAGVAFTAFRQTIASDAPPGVLTAPPPPTEFTHLGATPVVGVDVAIAISSRFSVVGFVRAQSLDFGSDPGGFSVRPGAAARVVF